MSEPQNTSLAEGLLAANREADTPNGTSTDFLERVLAAENAHEARVRRVALRAGSATLISVVLCAGCVLLIHAGNEMVVEAARVLLVGVGLIGTLSLLVAVPSYLAWLFRSRTPSLRAIERRLAALERLLMQRGAG